MIPLTTSERFLQALEDIHRLLQPTEGRPTISVALDRLLDGIGGRSSTQPGNPPPELAEELAGFCAHNDPTGEAALRPDSARSSAVTITNQVSVVQSATNDLLAAYGINWIAPWPTGAAGRLDLAAETLSRLEPLVVEKPRIAGRRRVDRLARAADRLVDECAAALNRGPTEKERRETDLANQEPGCRSCARLEVAKGVRRWELVHGHGLCQWCLRHAGMHGGTGLKKGELAPAKSWPPLELLRAHHDGKRTYTKAG